MTSTLMQFFVYANLPPHLQAVSKPFCELAELVHGRITSAPPKVRELIAWIEHSFPANHESTWAQTKLGEALSLIDAFCSLPVGRGPHLDEVLRKVLESKDCAVRAVLYKPVTP